MSPHAQVPTPRGAHDRDDPGKVIWAWADGWEGVAWRAWPNATQKTCGSGSVGRLCGGYPVEAAFQNAR